MARQIRPKYRIIFLLLLVAASVFITDAAAGHDFKTNPYVGTLRPHSLNTIIDHACRHGNQTYLTILRGGGNIILLSGWNPFGYGLTELGTQFLSFEGSLDSDVGRFLATFKSGRKRKSILKDQWLEIVRVSKSGQSMRIYRLLDDLFHFCIQAGFLT